MRSITPGEKTGLVNLSERIPSLETDVRFYTGENFIGKPLPGYHAPVVWASAQCAEALQRVQHLLLAQGLSLRVYDGYRPQEAECAIRDWMEEPETMPEKAYYYPKLTKKQLMEKGFIKFPSVHRTGEALDVTLFKLSSGISLDMGSPYGYMSPASQKTYSHLTPRQVQNRLMLKYAMASACFKMNDGGWWHFELDTERWKRENRASI
ncbi:MAG: M15 family metallopeptidase [Eubacteriaceae bacterium]|jgi:D-alanyl-D-alanine dipeptidase|nr:M15 family metallopeptidase [Eubacteriaceae bacterium]